MKHRPTTRCCRIRDGVRCNKPQHQHGPNAECPGPGRPSTFYVHQASPNQAATSFSGEEIDLLADLFKAMLLRADTRAFARRPEFKAIAAKTAGLRRTIKARRAAR
jgi:hypothetical protein